MSRASDLLTAALLRPVNIVAPGVGLVLALTVAPWWLFPLSIALYATMVVLTVRDPAFVRRTLSAQADESAGEPIDWKALYRELGQGEWAAPLARISVAERNLAGEVAQAPDAARSVLSSTLAQSRAAATLGVQLARRLRDLDRALAGFAGMNPEASRREAHDKRARAAAATDEAARKALNDASTALEESAKTAESLRKLRERTSAQLESLAAMLESIAVRGVRLRVQSDDASGTVAETLGAEMDAVRETLGVLESMDDTSDAEFGRGGAAR
ncbi:MAG TPA: hypothetical protein VHV30_08900 [Polyangiaceae bacterium]|jgi:hypothetical protein|nr:hypothetical protein [Polyangiaceae bacterium]